MRGALNVCKSLPGGHVGIRALGGVGSVPDFEYPFPDFAWLPFWGTLGVLGGTELKTVSLAR